MIAFPVRDVIPSRTVPLVTIGLILVNAAAFLLQQFLDDLELRLLFSVYGVVPADFALPTVVTSMFLHAGWPHFLGNMLYLWIFGDNVEDRIGHGRFLFLYILCGTAAALGQTAAHPGSTVPMIGASGAISGVIGAYFVLFPHSRVLTFIAVFIFYIDLVEIPALFFLGFWFVLQLLSGVGSLGPGGGVAFLAPVAGFLTGVGLIHLVRRPEREGIEWIEQGE